MNNDTKPICKISLHQSLPLISDATPKWSQAACLCGLYFLYYVFAFIFWHPKKELFLKMCSLAFSSTGQKNNQAPNPPLMKTECTEVRYGCCQAKTANYTIPGKNSNDRRLKNKPFFLANDGKRHMNRTRDKRQKLWQGMNLPCWVMKLNDSSWVRKGCWEREREQGREEWGDFVQPGNWSHHKQIEFRSFWWARADQSIWPTTQCLSASQKDTLASNNRSTVNNWSLGSVSLS